MNHVIITGGSGFIGSHLSDIFLEKGFAVTAVDNLITGREENLDKAKKNPNFRFVNQDISDGLPESRLELLAQHGLHGILHFACPASPVDFERIPFDILAVDSIGTAHSVDLAMKYNARFLLASTSEVYGDPLEHPQKEEYWGNVNSIGPRACYDEAKRFAEAYVSTAIAGKGSYKGKEFRALNGGMVRIFNTYGPRMRPDDGRLVPELCMEALHGKNLSVHGDGKQTRSFTYVTDLVDGIVKLYESQVHEPVNIGNPVENTVLEFADCLTKLSGSSSKIVHLPGRIDDPKRRCPDITRAKKLLGWEPKVKLEDGLKLTLEYFKTF